jgi:argininosuccinate lyase
MAAKKNKKQSKQSEKSWQGRLTADADAQTAEMLASLDIDFALWRYDIVGSIAHAEMLQKCKLISKAELAKIKSGLKVVATDLQAGKLELRIELEDIHMVIENALIDRIGAVGGKLHTGRSRNDQVATDLRLWARDAGDNLNDAIVALQTALVAKADQYSHVVMPAYTHLQRAQPTLAGHAILAYAEMLQRDRDRLADARKRTDICPLGSGAVAGTSLPLDRQMTAKTLGFSDITRNSIDATSDRDFLAELCFVCAMTGVHLSRWAEDWIIYSSVEFGAIELNDAYCTSSSMMPQKKNADTLELIRGKSATAIAQLTGILTLIKGLPLAYNRDLQDDKRFAFATVAAIRQALAVAAGIVATTEFNESKIAAGLDAGFLDATALAEYITAKGTPFRTAHQIVGKLVASAEQQGKTLAEIPLTELQSACDNIEPDVAKYLGAANVVKRYAPEGSAGAKQLRKQLAFWNKELG